MGNLSSDNDACAIFSLRKRTSLSLSYLRYTAASPPRAAAGDGTASSGWCALFAAVRVALLLGQRAGVIPAAALPSQQQQSNRCETFATFATFGTAASVVWFAWKPASSAFAVVGEQLHRCCCGRDHPGCWGSSRDEPRGGPRSWIRGKAVWRGYWYCPAVKTNATWLAHYPAVKK